MEIVERIQGYITLKGITAYAFEKACDLSNGYLNSRKGGTRGIGSEILEKIYRAYPDLNLVWLITGDGEMIVKSQAQPQAQQQAQPKKSSKEEASENGHAESVLSPGFVIQVLQGQISTLTASNADKDRIIRLLEDQIKHKQTADKR